jgi:outer membrane receptor protein involved in Fe transport
MHGENTIKTILSASAALIALTGVAHAQQSPPPAPAPAAESEEDVPLDDEIVVLAQPGDQVRIDRRTYTLRDDAAAQTTNMFDVLGRVPSVSVAPSGAVTLLGADNVTIQINGQPVPGNNLEQVLRGLTGGEVERIEVITNPSAQYSAQTSGGIINIITRQRFNAGLNGSLTGNIDTQGSYHAGFSPSWSRGPWSFSGQMGFFGGEQNTDFERERTVFAGNVVTTEEGEQRVRYHGGYIGRLQAGYQPDERTRMNLAIDTVRSENKVVRETETRGTGGPIAALDSFGRPLFTNQQLTFNYQRDGEQPREQVRFNAMTQIVSFGIDQEVIFTPTGLGPNAFLSRMRQSTENNNFRLDYDRPMADERFLTLGASFEQSQQTLENAREQLLGASTVADYSALLEGVQETLAGYATFQFTTGDWTWQPGVRGENYRREVLSSGIENDETDLSFFPSVHIRRELTPSINMDVSYSQRIARPGFQQLDPALRFNDANRAQGGNPNLRPTMTDAYEANFTYQRGGANFGVTLYDRISEDIFSPFTETTPDGIIITRPVNAGSSEQRGMQVTMRGPLGERWRYSLTGNFLNRDFDVLGVGVTTSRRSEFEYDGTAQIDYRDPDQNVIGADQLQLELRFQGPRHTLQSDSDEFIVANFTWRRRLSEQLFGVLSVQDIFSSQTNVQETTTETYFERQENSSLGARLQLAFTYQFGANANRPPPDQNGPPQFGGPPPG